MSDTPAEIVKCFKTLEQQSERIRELEQANKELLEVLRIYADAANWKCPRCGKSDSLNCYMGRWCGPSATTGREMPDGGFPGEGHGYDVARAALSKHGEE